MTLAKAKVKGSTAARANEQSPSLCLYNSFKIWRIQDQRPRRRANLAESSFHHRRGCRRRRRRHLGSKGRRRRRF